MSWSQARLNPLRIFTPRGKGIDTFGRNRYTQEAVDANGLTAWAFEVQEWINTRHPDSPTKVNFAVDRDMRSKPGVRSIHAEGRANDNIIQRFDGPLGVSDADREYGWRVFNDLVATMVEGVAAGAVGRGRNGKKWAGGLHLEMTMFDGHIAYAGEGGVIRPVNEGVDPHFDHIHSQVAMGPAATTSGAEATDPPPPKDPRRELRYRKVLPAMTGDDVRLVQSVVGAEVDGRYGPETAAKVEEHQRAHGLEVDGMVGPKTWAQIDEDTVL